MEEIGDNGSEIVNVSIRIHEFPSVMVTIYIPAFILDISSELLPLFHR